MKSMNIAKKDLVFTSVVAIAAGTSVSAKTRLIVGAKLSGGNLKRSVLKDADLSGTDLSGGNLKRSVLKDTDLSGTDLSGVKASNLQNCPSS